MFTVTKTYRDLPAAHRQPNHKGHCRLIHGHNWSFDITFGCDKLDANGFVVDVGELGAVHNFLKSRFDHTLLLNQDDPFLEHLQKSLSSQGEAQPGLTTVSDFAKIVVVPNCGMEGLAQFVFEWVRDLVTEQKRGLRPLEVTCWEDSKNRATYKP